MFRRSLLVAPLFAATSLALGACVRTNPAPIVDTTNIFFTANSADLDSAARSSIEKAADVAKRQPNSTVHVRGFSAPDAGSTAFNQALANTRAQAVADALVQAGVPRIQLSMETRGAVPFELMPTESRRVTIVVG